MTGEQLPNDAPRTTESPFLPNFYPKSPILNSFSSREMVSHSAKSSVLQKVTHHIVKQQCILLKCKIIFGKEFFGRNLIWCLFVYNRSSSLIHSGVTNDARPPSPRSSPDSISLKVQISRFLVSRFSREYRDLPDLEAGLTGWHNSVCRNQLTAPSVIQLQGLFHLK